MKLELIESKPELNKDLIKMLEGLLEEAKTGELNSAFFVCDYVDGTTTGYSFIRLKKAILGEIDLLKMQIMEYF